jgi:outer membrane protein assembly factor BamE (lipoprotein component of BamABCDE complex)
MCGLRHHFNKTAVIFGGMVSSRLAAALAAGFAIAALAGCAADVAQRGNLPPPDKLAELHPGSTTKEAVAKLLGTPSSIGVFDDKAWYYISRRTKQVAFFEPDVLDQQVYVLKFDEKGVLTTIDHKGLEDGQIIDPVARTTPAPGRELSFLEQLIGNLGRFNNSSPGK